MSVGRDRAPRGVGMKKMASWEGFTNCFLFLIRFGWHLNLLSRGTMTGRSVEPNVRYPLLHRYL